MRKLILLGAILSAVCANAASAQTPTLGAPPAATAAEAQAPTQPLPGPDPTSNIDQAATLGTGDVVDVGIIGRNDYTGRVRVGADGSVVLPLLGKVKAGGRTATELAEDIGLQLSKGGYYANPVVRVEIVGVASRYITIFGNVSQGGILPLDRTYRLSDIVARIGAKAGTAEGYVVLTPAGGKPQRYSIEGLATGTAEQDPIVQAGDKIYVPEPASEVVYISGQVKSPGAYPVVGTLTLRMLIAKAGGLTEVGSEKKVKVYRGDKPLKGMKPESKVEPGDIISIGEKLF